MVYVTGDTHGDFRRFSTKNFPEQKMMTKDDCVIVLGDFGGVWDYGESSKNEKYWLDWLDAKPFTTLFIDGNHENFDRLESEFPRTTKLEIKDGQTVTYFQPQLDRFGSSVSVVRPSILHLHRGCHLHLEGTDFLVLGGASSHDIEDGILEQGDRRIPLWNKIGKRFRVNHVTWWKEELPDSNTISAFLIEAMTLTDIGERKPIILTHSPCGTILRQVHEERPDLKFNRMTYLLDRLVEFDLYSHWYFGHLHMDREFPEERMTAVYKKIIRVL